MDHKFKYLGNKESMRDLWENKEALEKYIARLREFWDEENQCWLEKPNQGENVAQRQTSVATEAPSTSEPRLPNSLLPKIYSEEELKEIIRYCADRQVMYLDESNQELVYWEDDNNLTTTTESEILLNWKKQKEEQK